MKDEYSKAQMLAMIRKTVHEMPQAELARECGVSAQFLNDVVHGRRQISEKIAAYFGVAPVLVFRPLQSSAKRVVCNNKARNRRNGTGPLATNEYLEILGYDFRESYLIRPGAA